MQTASALVPAETALIPPKPAGRRPVAAVPLAETAWRTEAGNHRSPPQHAETVWIMQRRKSAAAEDPAGAVFWLTTPPPPIQRQQWQREVNIRMVNFFIKP